MHFHLSKNLSPKATPRLRHLAIMQSSLAGNSLAKAIAKENALLGGGALLPHNLCGLYLL